MKKILLIAGIISASSTLTLSAQNIADIDYGSTPALGGALFYGTDAAQADSISVGYFSTGAANIALTNWVTLATDSTFEAAGFNTASGTDLDVTAGVNKDAWVLISDAGGNGLARLDSWVSISGGVSPSPKSSLDYTFGSTATVATITGINVTIADSAGQGAQGVSISVGVVPEPSTYALLVGALALGFVAIRRRK